MLKGISQVKCKDTKQESASENEVAQLCPTLCDPVECSLPGFSVHGILQEKILEWGAISFSGDLPDPWIEPGSPTLDWDTLTSEPPGKLFRKSFYEESPGKTSDNTWGKETHTSLGHLSVPTLVWSLLPNRNSRPNQQIKSIEMVNTCWLSKYYCNFSL